MSMRPILSISGMCILFLLTLAGCGGEDAATEQSNNNRGPDSNSLLAENNSEPHTQDGESLAPSDNIDNEDHQSGLDDDWSDEDWPEAPDLMATVCGHWSFTDGGELYLSKEEKRDDIGFRFQPGIFIKPDGSRLEIRWHSIQEGFGTMDDGGRRYFEATLMVDADESLPFTDGSSTSIAFDVGTFQEGRFMFYPDVSSLDVTSVEIKRIDSKESPDPK